MLSLSARLHRLSLAPLARKKGEWLLAGYPTALPGKRRDGSREEQIWNCPEAGDCTYIKTQNEHTVWGLPGVCTNGSNCFGRARGFPRGTRSVYLRDPIEGASPRSPHPWLWPETFYFYLLYILCFCFRVLCRREQRKISSDKKKKLEMTGLEDKDSICSSNILF